MISPKSLVLMEMLTKLRKLVKPLSHRVGKFLGGLGISPNTLTWAGLALALLTPVPAYYQRPWITLTLLTASSVLDVLDGAVAKACGLTSRKGAFLDSFSDRVSDASFITALLLLGLKPLTTIMILATSLLISYARARGEALSLRMEGVGLMERGDRILYLGFLMVLFGINAGWWAEFFGWVMIFLNSVTIIHRVAYIMMRG